MRIISQRVQKARERFRIRRSRGREVVAAVKRIDSADRRTFADAEVLGKQHRLVGHGGQFKLAGKRLTRTRGNVGCYRPTVFLGSPGAFWRGSIHYRTRGAPVKYEHIGKSVTIYRCPYREQTTYFRVDFWQTFGLAPAVVGKPMPSGVNEA